MSQSKFSYESEYHRAMNLRQSDPDSSIEILNRIRETAIKENNREWRLVAEHWRSQVYISFKRDFISATRFAIEAAVEARKPEYRHFYEYICIQYDLILVYDGIDPVGYAPEVKEAIDLTIEQTRPNVNCHYCLNRRLIDYYRSIGDEAKARDQAAKFFAMTQNTAHYRIRAYGYLCYFSRQDEAWADLLELSRRGYELAQDYDDENCWIELKSYEMLALQKLAQTEVAQKASELLKYRTTGLKAVQSDEYFDNFVAYHEARRDLEMALVLRNEHLAFFKDTGRYYWEAIARLDKIRLLRLLGQDYQDESQSVRLLAQKLKFPEKIIALLEA